MSRDALAVPVPAVVTPRALTRHGGARSRRTWLRVLLLAGRREARWLTTSPLVLAGLLVSAWLIWLNNRLQAYPYAPTPHEFWWYADVSIVSCLLAAAGSVLLATQLAAGRARRDGMEQLYASYPAAPAARTGAHLISVCGPVLLAAAVTGAACAWLDRQGTLGSPRLWVLGAGLLLIVLGGAAGVALGSWLHHPMAGILTVLVIGLIEIDLVLSISNPVHLPGGTAWLFPWSDPGAVLAMLPGVTVPYPPPAHLAELAGLIALAVVAALWRPLRGRRALAAVAVAALAVTGWSGWSQARPVPSSVLKTMVLQATRPGPAQQCRQLQRVRYCYYPAFAPLAGQWAASVSGVLAKVPGSVRGLAVRQVNDSQFLQQPLLPPTSMTSIMSAQSPLSVQLGAFDQALSADPRLFGGGGRPPVYTGLDWGTGATLGSSQFGLALSTAQWVTGLPATAPFVTYGSSGSGGGTMQLTCVPLGQARQSVALWLAASATAGSRTAFEQSLAPASAGSTRVGRIWVTTVQEAGSGPSTGLTATAQGAALAAEMLRLPQRQVEAVLDRRWQHWLAPQTTAAGLAAALGVKLPAAPAAAPQPSSYIAGRDGQKTDESFNPPSPVCG
jgi:hypothetical protein